LSVGLPFVLGLLLQAAAPPEATPPPAQDVAPEPAPPEVVRQIVLEGSTAYSRDDTMRILRQREGQPLRTTPAALASRLESRYHIDGYLAATVSARMEDGRLILTVDEGRIASVAVEGVAGAAERRAVKAAHLEVGQVLEQAQVWDALARIEEESHGALKPEGDPPYTVERGPEGARVVLRVRRLPVRTRLGPAGPRAGGRYNRVDGLSAGLIGELDLHDTSTYDDLRLYGFGSWGFSSHKLRYALGAARTLGPESIKMLLGYEYHDLTDSDDTWRKVGLEEGTGGTINSQHTSDYFRRVGHQVSAVSEVERRFQVGASFRFDHYTSLPVVTDDRLFGYKDPRPNPVIEEGRLRSLVLTAGWVSRGALFPTRAARKQSYVERNLYQLGVTKPEAVRLEATFEVARPGWGGDYDFTRLIGNLRTHHELGRRVLLDSRLVAGRTGGEPPLFKRFFLGGQGTLRGYEAKQFDGRDMALLTVETTLLPNHRLPALIPFYDGGRTWGAGAHPAESWRNDLGLGLRWPGRGTSFFVRVDGALPLDPDPGQERKLQFTFCIRIPF